MKLNEHQIDVVSFEIARALAQAELISGSEDRIARSVAQAIEADLRVEEELDVEVHEVLKTYERYMRQNNVEYGEMFDRIKRKLAQERKLVL